MGEAMGKVPPLPYVKEQRDRHGRAYWYFRRNGRYWRLPGKAHSEEWMAAYHEAKAASEPKAPLVENPAVYPPQSMGALILEYQASPEWRGLKPASKRVYGYVLGWLIKKGGQRPVALIRRKHIKKWRDARSETPGMANMVVSVARTLMAFAVDNEHRDDNPALRIKLFRLGEHRAWTPEELMAFEHRWPAGTMQRRAYALARYTGQRCGDLAAMTRAHRRGGMIRVVQQKTGAELWVAEHRELMAELGRGEQGHMSLLTKADGGSFDGEGLSPWFADAIENAGLPDDCVMHGLRKVAARDLADAGCSEHEIMSVTGHKSLAEVQRYTKAADQKRLAKAAILKLEQNGKRTPSGKRPSGRSGKQRLDD
jgi:integrase